MLVLKFEFFDGLVAKGAHHLFVVVALLLALALSYQPSDVHRQVIVCVEQDLCVMLRYKLIDNILVTMIGSPM
jgi:hypothetical protein